MVGVMRMRGVARRRQLTLAIARESRSGYGCCGLPAPPAFVKNDRILHLANASC